MRGPGGRATLPPVPKRARRTLQDVADAAGLSLAATSYALRGTRGSPATIERVQTLAVELGYRVDPIARALASGRTGTVGVSGSLRDLWQQDLSVMLTRALRAVDRDATIADADADPAVERRVVERFAQQRVDAAIVSPVDPSAGYWSALPPTTAVVSLGDALPGRPGSGAVLFDNRHGVTTAVEHLHALGHRRLALLTPSLPTTPGPPLGTAGGGGRRPAGAGAARRARPAPRAPPEPSRGCCPAPTAPARCSACPTPWPSTSTAPRPRWACASPGTSPWSASTTTSSPGCSPPG